MLLLHDIRGGVLLRVERVRRHHDARNVQVLKERLDLRDLVRLDVHGNLRHHGPAAMHDGAQQMNRVLSASAGLGPTLGRP